jgi:hypothetical protein
MQVTMLVYRPYEREPEITEFGSEPDLFEVEAAVGGRLEQVPGLFSIEHDGVVHRCVALCLKEGRQRGLPLNVAATILWDSALRRDMGVGLIRADGSRADYLVGSIAIFIVRQESWR